MIEIGRYNTLTVEAVGQHGWVLSDGEQRVLLPFREAPPEAEEGVTVRVFVYTDSKDRPVATGRVPLAVVGEIAFLRVTDDSPHGAFLDWGLDKDLFVPKNQQHRPLKVGKRYVVRVYLDERTNRVAAATRLSPYLDYDVSALEAGQEVRALVYDHTDLGALAVVNGRHAGLIYASDTFQPIRVGDTVTAYVKTVRDDNKLDLRLQREGDAGRDDAQSAVLDGLRKAGGYLPLHDKSDPEAIARHLKLSKKAFKRAIGALYKARMIDLEGAGIRLVY